MITRLISPSTATAVFSAHELPEEVHEPIVRQLVTSRVISSSMVPTLCPGDQLELGPADACGIGDLVVFRYHGPLVCHRIACIADQYVYTKGDANDGSPERIKPSDIVATVTAILRNGSRLAVPPRPHADNLLIGRESTDRRAAWNEEPVRSLVRNAIQRIMSLPLIGRGISRIIGQLAVVDVMEQAQLQSVTSYVRRRTFRLSSIAELRHYLAAATLDLARITLVIRAGPVFLGTCRLAPWSMQIRPLAAALGLTALFDTLRGLMDRLRPRTDSSSPPV